MFKGPIWFGFVIMFGGFVWIQVGGHVERANLGRVCGHV